ncbi:MAG: fibronectin type III domain-containing protein, partial [Spirochaetaceae bacterium]|nr:fibronectin type III domain-containing protein [Spirochaetaceae bacterium]
ENLPLGDYTVSVSALDADGQTLAAGSTAGVTVFGEGEDRVDVSLMPVMGGTGTLSLEYNWLESGVNSGFVTNALAVIQPTGGASKNINVMISPEGLTYDGTLPTGEYSLSVDLYSDGVLVGSIIDKIQIFDNFQSEKRKDFGPELFYTIPESPAPEPPIQHGLSVKLRWEDNSDTETGYRVERSENGGEFAVVARDLPPSSVSWTDAPVEPDMDYTYRIVAINSFGISESQELLIKIKPLVTSPERSDDEPIDITLGGGEAVIPLSRLLEGFENNWNRRPFEVFSVSLPEGAEIRIEGDFVKVDTSNIPRDLDGTESVLQYSVHIPGEPMNSPYTASGAIPVKFEVSESEEVREEDLLEPLQAYVYDSKSEMQSKMREYEPADPRDIFDNWGRLSNQDYFGNKSDAQERNKKEADEADLATWWRLDFDDDDYLRYAKNSVYAGLVCPDGREIDRFTLEATLSSGDDDDDSIGLIVAFVRENGENYVLEAARSFGAKSGDVGIEPSLGWGLVVRRLYGEAQNREIGEVLWSRQIDMDESSDGGWDGAQTRVKVERNGDRVSISASLWNEPDSYSSESAIDIQIDSIPELRRFSGPQKFGYFTASQQDAAFQDIVFNSDVIQDKVFFLDPRTKRSEVWWFDPTSKRWIRMSGATIQSVVGHP